MATKKKTPALPRDVQTIVDEVARHFDLPVSDLLGHSRMARHSDPRHVAMYFCRELLGLTWPHISELFDRSARNAAVVAHQKISAARDEDPVLAEHVSLLEPELRRLLLLSRTGIR